MLTALAFEMLDHWNKLFNDTVRSMADLSELMGDGLDQATRQHARYINSYWLAGTRQWRTTWAYASPRFYREPACARKRALVTGGIHDIGTAICRKLNDADIEVVASYASADGTHARCWQAEQRRDGYFFTIVECDVADFDACARMARYVESYFGAVDILVNCPPESYGRARQPSRENWHSVLDTNLDSVFNVTRNLIEGMVKRHYGRIINIAAVDDPDGHFGQSRCAAAKAGLVGFTKSLAREVADLGITVNTVLAGAPHTDTGFASSAGVAAPFATPIPSRTLSQPEEIGDAVIFLATEDSGYITGTDIGFNSRPYSA
jgi:acetoacetyl-CoA reductase